MDTVALLTYAQMCYATNNLPLLLSTTTLGSSTASVTYNVVNPYNRIMVGWGANGTTAANGVQLQLQMNGNTASTYLWAINQSSTNTVSGSSSSGLASSIQVGTITAGSATTNYWSSGTFFVEGTNQSTHNPTVVGIGTAFATDANPPVAWVGTYGGQYVSNVPVTSLTLFPLTGSFNAGSYFAFYGLS